jgi:poly-gamma-glutamate synthesis protein (capsule biosynthesis protein)
VRTPIVLGFAGDTTFTNGLEQRDPFAEVARLLQAPDLMVVNLETTVADPGVGRPPVDKRFLFRSPPESLDLVVDAGIDVVALANNHTLDFGVDALAQTIEEIDARSLRHVGAGLDESSAYEPLILDVGDWTVGLVSLSRVPCDWAAPGQNVRPQVAWACPTLFDQAEAATAAALDESDVVVVMIHGGEEGVLCPSPFMIELEQVFADMGVDAVINGHPHVLQGITRRGGTWVAHSLGNFAFPPARGITGNSAIVQLHVSEGGIGISVVPVRSDGGVLSVPTDQQRAEILGQVDRHSHGVAIDDSGAVRIDDTNAGAC